MRPLKLMLMISLLLAGISFGCSGHHHDHYYDRDDREIYVRDHDYREHWRENYRDRGHERRDHDRHERNDRGDRRGHRR